VGRNKKIRASLAGLERTIEDHKRKIAFQRAQRIPDEGLIAKWERDIAVFEEQRARLLRRLRRDW
jgi:hypothetical protein